MYLLKGVETEAQLHYLQEEKCDYVQGYYTGRPMPVSTIIQKYRVTEAGKYPNGNWTVSTTNT